MASKAVARVKCDWAKLTQNGRPENVQRINQLKATFDSTAVKVSSLPDSLPQIDWSYYKQHASDPKVVQDIEKMYGSIKIKRPAPPANRLEELNYHHNMDKKRFEKFTTYVQEYMESIEIVRSKFEKMIPINEMNMEDWSLTFPHWSFTIDTPPTWGWALDRTIGLSREEAAAFAVPDPIPFSNKRAWKDWEKYKDWYK